MKGALMVDKNDENNNGVVASETSHEHMISAQEVADVFSISLSEVNSARKMKLIHGHKIGPNLAFDGSNWVFNKRNLPKDWQVIKQQMREKREKSYWYIAVGSVLLVLGLIWTDINSVPSDSRSTSSNQYESDPSDGFPEPTGNETEVLTGQDNGYAWQAASEEVRRSLSADIANDIGGEYDGDYYYDAINTAFNTDDSDILQQQIAEVAGFASVQ